MVFYASKNKSGVSLGCIPILQPHPKSLSQSRKGVLNSVPLLPFLGKEVRGWGQTCNIGILFKFKAFQDCLESLHED